MKPSNQSEPTQASHPVLSDTQCDAILAALFKNTPTVDPKSTDAFCASVIARIHAEQTASSPDAEKLEKMLFSRECVLPSKTFTVNTLDRIHAGDEVRRPSAFWRISGSLAVAAALLMAIGIYVQQKPQTVNEPIATTVPAAATESAPAIVAAPVASEPPILATDWSTALALAEARDTAQATGFASASSLPAVANSYRSYNIPTQAPFVSAAPIATGASQSRAATDPNLVNAFLLADGLNDARSLLDADSMQALVVLSH